METTTALLRWYGPRRTAFPWRGADPYGVLVSEVMLQQTQAARVARLYPDFVARFPSVDALAAASRAEVVRAWSGLGYNRRALSLSEAARAIVRDHAGRVPRDPEVLQSLPGIGPYTAAAIAAFAYGREVPAIDTNVRRVVARARMGRDAHEVTSAEVRAEAERWIRGVDPAAWNQALMDVGREVCRTKPACQRCPVARWCAFRARGAVPSRRPTGTSPFEGSSRQVRGAVIHLLRPVGSLTLRGLAAGSGHPVEVVADAVRGLARDGLVRAGPAALRGAPSGRVRLSDA
ncbi:MAG TPA: A/G-specific adenine glycosylase [Actinomycetota bacterium]|nr:A/G-specific adenine glycosylase [Actinomycetota bacterium]